MSNLLKQIINKGTGAGGSKTNEFGKKFEQLTCVQNNLLMDKYTKKILCKTSKYGYYFNKKFEDCEISYVTQTGFKKYVTLILKKSFEIWCPDEAYIIHKKDGTISIKILEKKEQHSEGSIDTKLWAGPSIKRSYQILFPECNVEYAFCLNNFFKTKFNDSEKYKLLAKILKENNIPVFFGEDEDYFKKLNDWICFN